MPKDATMTATGLVGGVAAVTKNPFFTFVGKFAPFLTVGVGLFRYLRKGKDEDVGTQHPPTTLRLEESDAQYLLGEERDEGVLAWWGQDGPDLHLVLGITEGVFEGPTHVFAENKLYKLIPFTENTDPVPSLRPAPNTSQEARTDYSGGTGSNPKPNIVVYPYPADMTFPLRWSTARRASDRCVTWALRYNLQIRQAEEDSVEARRSLVDVPPRFTNQHRGENISGLHVVLHQDENTTWQRFPDDLSFVIRGIKFPVFSSVYGLTEERRRQLGVPVGAPYSDSPLAHLFWWLTHIRKIPASRINTHNFLDAYAYAEQILTYDWGPDSPYGKNPDAPDEGYSPQSKRYSSNGKILSNDDPRLVEDQLLAACAGQLVYEDASYSINIGRPVEPKWTIRREDMLQDAQLTVGHGSSRNITGVRNSLAQSREHDYEPLELPPVRDPSQPPGEIADNGRLAFVNDPNQAHRLAHVDLAQRQDPRVATIVVGPGEGFERVAMRIGEGVSLLDPTIGADGETWIIQRFGMNENLQILLILIPEPDYRPKAGPLPLKGEPKVTGTPAGVTPPTGEEELKAGI